MMNILITGANRGLGLEFTRQYLDGNNKVIAACRNPKKAIELDRLKTDYKESLIIVKLDVTDSKSRDEAFDEIRNNFNTLDLLINNAGIISGGNKKDFYLGEFYSEDMEKVFAVNAVAPLLIIEKFLPLLENAHTPKIVNISSMMGSISSKTGTIRYSYSASKAALNMFTKMLSNDLTSKSVIVISMHPGWVQTDMGGDHAPLVPEESIKGMIKVIDSLKLDDTGKYLDWQRHEIPW